jgi:hypothetical protein
MRISESQITQINADLINNELHELARKAKKRTTADYADFADSLATD